MAYVVTLTGFTPSPRYDTLPWTQARVEEAATEDGTFTALETITLSPVDANPEEPAERSVTTHAATLEQGWYRLVFRDAAGREESSGAVFHDSSAPEDYSPSVSDVAAFLHTRLRVAGGVVPATFTSGTTPTAAQVRRMIDLQTPLVLMDTGDLSDDALICPAPGPANVRAAVRSLIAMQVARTVELSYWTEEVVNSGRTAEEYWDGLVSDLQPKVVQAARECRLGEVVPGDESESLEPWWLFSGVGQPAYVVNPETGAVSQAPRLPLTRRW